jgi:Transposase DDE domain
VTGAELKKHMTTVLDLLSIETLASEYRVVQRDRQLDIVSLVVALILAGGTHEGGRQYDVLRTYIENGAPSITRGAFYSWFHAPLERLMNELLRRAIEVGQQQEKILPGILAGVTDWRIVDSTTIKLDKALFAEYPGAGDYAALKIHKEWSVGTGNLVSYQITPARDHDSPALIVNESRRGTGLLVDLGYASIDRISECETFDVRYVLRLKDNWKPRIDRLVRGSITGDVAAGADLDVLIDEDILILDGHAIDADVTLGRLGRTVKSRLVGVPTPKGYCFFLTNLPRKTHGPLQVGDLYRVRWEIEIDNKVDKSAARIDEVTARKPVSVRILVLASLLNSTIARTIVQSEKLAILALSRKSDTPGAARAPLHPILLMRALSSAHGTVVRLLLTSADDDDEWTRLMERLRGLGHDPNWRRRPSVLDRIQGLTASPGRARNERAQ